MAVVFPFVFDGSNNMVQADQEAIDDLNEFAGWVHAQVPSVELQIGNYGSDPNLLSGFPLTDTYYIAGSSTSRVDRFATEAETPNISQSSTVYNSCREVRWSDPEPTGDLNNFQFPVYLANTATENYQIQAMTRQDFIDTFVTPVIDQFTTSATGTAQGGTYFISTAAAPANATQVGTFFADTIADTSAYTSGGIPESTYQPLTVNTYYLHKVDYPETSYAVITGGDQFPIYFDATDETLRVHTPESWRDLLAPFINYELANNATKKISYNINGSGLTVGTSMIDTRRVPTGTGYTTRFVNADDYRTQEFPNGTPQQVGISQSLRIKKGN